MAFVGLVSLVIPILVARHYGALGIPRGDDWSYLQTLFRFADHGHLDGNHWVSMTLVGQVGASLPIVWLFGHNITAVQIGAAMMGFGGLLATLWLGVPMIGRARAALVVVTLAVGPLWGPLAVSYMTDVPAFAATMLALALAIAALRRAPLSVPLLGAGLVAGVFAFSIRQYAIVPVLAIVVTVLWVAVAAGDRQRLRVIVVMSTASVVACGVIYALWNEIPNLKLYAPTLPNGHSLAVTDIKGGGFVRLVGLLLLPVVALAGPVTIVRRAWRRRAIRSQLSLSPPKPWIRKTGTPHPRIRNGTLTPPRRATSVRNPVSLAAIRVSATYSARPSASSIRSRKVIGYSIA